MKNFHPNWNNYKQLPLEIKEVKDKTEESELVQLYMDTYMY